MSCEIIVLYERSFFWNRQRIMSYKHNTDTLLTGIKPRSFISIPDSFRNSVVGKTPGI